MSNATTLPDTIAEELRAMRQALADLEQEIARASGPKRDRMQAFYKAARQDLTSEIARLKAESDLLAGRNGRAPTADSGAAVAGQAIAAELGRAVGQEMRRIEARLARIEARQGEAREQGTLRTAPRASPAVRPAGLPRGPKGKVLVVRTDGSSRLTERHVLVVRLDGSSRMSTRP